MVGQVLHPAPLPVLGLLGCNTYPSRALDSIMQCTNQSCLLHLRTHTQHGNITAEVTYFAANVKGVNIIAVPITMSPSKEKGYLAKYSE